MMHTLELSLTARDGGNCAKLAISAVSAQSIACAGNTVILTPDVNCFFRMGDNPTAVVDTDQILLASRSYRVTVVPGLKLAFVAGGAGFVYITQEP